MELRITAAASSIDEIPRVIKIVSELEKEYNCNCTLLDLKVNCKSTIDITPNKDGLYQCQEVQQRKPFTYKEIEELEKNFSTQK